MSYSGSHPSWRNFESLSAGQRLFHQLADGAAFGA